MMISNGKRCSCVSTLGGTVPRWHSTKCGAKDFHVSTGPKLALSGGGGFPGGLAPKCLGRPCTSAMTSGGGGLEATLEFGAEQCSGLRSRSVAQC